MGWFLRLVTLVIWCQSVSARWWRTVFCREKLSFGCKMSSMFLQYNWGCQGITGSSGLLYWLGKSCYSKHCVSFKNENWLYSFMLANIPSPHKRAQAPVSLLLCTVIKSGMTWPHPSFFHRTSLSFSAQAGWCSMPGLVRISFFPASVCGPMSYSLYLHLNPALKTRTTNLL